VGITDQLASSLGREDDAPNVALAEALVASPYPDSVAELVEILSIGSAAESSDAIKVLYELAARDPDQVVPHTDALADYLLNRNTRLVWGAATALDAIAQAHPDAVAVHTDALISAVKAGSVITQDHGIGALAATERWDALAFVLDHLASCGAKYLPLRAERVAPHFVGEWGQRFRDLVSKRLDEASASGQTRLKRLLKDVNNS
jgi:hypothetical protein